MKWLKKRSSDVIDLSKMQHHEAPPKREEIVIDTQPKEESPNLNFLDTLASNAPAPSQRYSPTPSHESPGPITSQLRSARQNNASEINEVKLKLDDSEFKIEQLERRIKELEEKMRRFG